MNLLSLKTIKELLLEHAIRPSKGLGQNFLVSKSVLQKIIEAAQLSPDDIVLEVGPGIGTLTQALAPRVKKVIAVEKDKKMVDILAETLKDHHNIELITKDILKVSSFEFPATRYKVVANIPYYITAPLIRKFLEADNQPTMMVLMVQKEVAQRICARPPQMSLLAVAVQFYAACTIASYVPKDAFWPAPNVDSAIIKIIPKPLGSPTSQRFFQIVKAGFSHPHKQLANNLSQTFKKNKASINKWLVANSIMPEQRAESLSVRDWLNLAENFSL